MRIFVVGGTGFIGARVVERLATEHDVTALHRGKHAPPLPAAVRRMVGDRDRLAEHAAEFRQWSPDVVLDMISGDEHQARAVVDAFHGIARRLVTVSSMDVYRSYEISLGLTPESIDAPLEPVPLTEDSPLRTVLYPYRNRDLSSIFDWVTPEYDKTIVERVARSQPSLPATIVRLPMVYGPGDPLHRFFPFLKRMAAAIALAVTSDAAAGRTYNIAEAEALPWAGWARAVGQAAGWNGRILTLPRERTPAHLIPPFNAAQHWTPDTSRIRAELGYREAISREAALAFTVAWERAHPAPFNPAAFDYDAEDRC